MVEFWNTLLSTLEAVYTIIFELVVYFPLCWSQKFSFLNPASYKDELGKILYVFMTFLNTNRSIVSFGEKIGERM